MKEIVLENVLNHERFVCVDIRDIQVIDGVQYLKVHRQGNDRIMLVRKDALKKVTQR